MSTGAILETAVIAMAVTNLSTIGLAVFVVRRVAAPKPRPQPRNGNGANGAKVWGLATRSRRICPANAQGALIWRNRPLREMAVDDVCRRDCARNGNCWCGNLRQGAVS